MRHNEEKQKKVRKSFVYNGLRGGLGVPNNNGLVSFFVFWGWHFQKGRGEGVCVKLSIEITISYLNVQPLLLLRFCLVFKRRWWSKKI